VIIGIRFPPPWRNARSRLTGNGVYGAWFGIGPYPAHHPQNPVCHFIDRVRRFAAADLGLARQRPDEFAFIDHA
jgi:hypothetical protein